MGLTLVAAVPFLALGTLAVWTERKVALILATIASLILVAMSAYGYWVVFFPSEDSNSTDALIFLLIIPVQWVVAVIASVTESARADQQPVT